jgi:hypothetical protein
MAVWMALAVSALGAPKLPPIRPEVQGVLPHGGQRGTDVDLVIRGENLHGATQILFATPRLSATILSAEHNPLRARFHIARPPNRAATTSASSLRMGPPSTGSMSRLAKKFSKKSPTTTASMRRPLKCRPDQRHGEVRRL